jgi:hypothetical protein
LVGQHQFSDVLIGQLTASQQRAGESGAQEAGTAGDE